jgi:hypothetical protein
MKVLVDELPKDASDCVFGKEPRDSWHWGEITCKISDCRCSLQRGNECPYLKELQNG